MAGTTVTHTAPARPDGWTGIATDWASDQRAFKNVPWGKAMMWIFLLSDTFVFGCFLLSYMTARMSTRVPWPNPSEVFALHIGGTNVPLILMHGAEWFREAGTATDIGTKIFSFSGDIARVGFMEVPFGVPMRQVIDVCGGIVGGGRLKAIQAGGPLAGYLPGSFLDELSLEADEDDPEIIEQEVLEIEEQGPED